MIRVTIERNAHDRSIGGFMIEGHALFANPGNDIVCAGVSAVSVGTVNAIEALSGVELQTRMESGLLQAVVPRTADESKRADVQLLLESMVVMLETIRQSYGKHVSVQDITK